MQIETIETIINEDKLKKQVIKENKLIELRKVLILHMSEGFVPKWYVGEGSKKGSVGYGFCGFVGYAYNDCADIIEKFPNEFKFEESFVEHKGFFSTKTTKYITLRLIK